MLKYLHVIFIGTILVGAWFVYTVFTNSEDSLTSPPDFVDDVREDASSSVFPSPETATVYTTEETIDRDKLAEDGLLNEPEYLLRQMEEQFEFQIDQIRQDNDLPRLKWNDDLSDVARRHSEDQAQDTKKMLDQGAEVDAAIIRHIGTTFGQTHEERLKNSNIFYFSSSGENIVSLPLIKYSVVDKNDPATILQSVWKTNDELIAEGVQSWLDSPGHRENIMRDNYTDTGVGIARVGDFIIVTQLFITRASCGYTDGQCCADSVSRFCFDGLRCTNDSICVPKDDAEEDDMDEEEDE
jgi:uncharacterized protein YkwD